jgi:hypothetical protein
MSLVPGQRDHDLLHVERARAQPAESVPAVLKSSLKLSLGKCQLF